MSAVFCQHCFVHRDITNSTTSTTIQTHLQGSRRSAWHQDYDKVQNWFSDHRMQGVGATAGKCLERSDLISFAVSINNIYWITILMHLRQRAVCVLDSQRCASLGVYILAAVWIH